MQTSSSTAPPQVSRLQCYLEPKRHQVCCRKAQGQLTLLPQDFCPAGRASQEVRGSGRLNPTADDVNKQTQSKASTKNH
eukprot:1084121-Amphidinium_carterae.1